MNENIVVHPSQILTDREVEVLVLVDSGISIQAIAEKLGLSYHTVCWYLKQIYKKLGVNRRTQAVSTARSLGILDNVREANSRYSSDILSDREVEVLRLMDAGLSNQAIAKSLVLSYHTVTWYIGQIFNKLDVNRRTQAIAAARSLGILEGNRQRESQPGVRHNLPSQLTSFIGRERELAELQALIADPHTRLITIVGPGGMGKTRLALAVAERILAGTQFLDGVFFVDLAALNEARLIPLAVAEALQIQLSSGGGGAAVQLLAYLANKNMLLLLDNFEHLSEGMKLVSEILRAAPGVQIIATSREQLHLRHEQLYPISGLECPDLENPSDAAEYTAPQLFLDAARRIYPDFELLESNLAPLTRLCQLVDGMPLALELAAGWVGLLSISKIATEIECSLDLLETEMQDVPDRHRSMQAVFEATWERLESAEQDMLQKLSVFRGGFTRQAARQVASVAGEAATTLALLGGLVKKSLLQADLARERYQIHNLLRQYASERLALSGELETVRTAHAHYFLRMLHWSEASIKCGQNQKATLNKIDTEFTNIRTAWQWALKQDNLEAIDVSMETLFWYFRIRYRWLEGTEFFRQVESRFDSNPERISNPIWRHSVLCRIYLDQYTGACDIEEHKKWVEDILAAAQQNGNPSEIGFALECKALFFYGENERLVIQNLEEARSIYQRIGDRFSEYQLLGLVSWFYLLTGNLEKRTALIHQQYKMAVENGDRLIAADARGVLGQIDERAGHYAQAENIYQEVLPVFQEFRNWGHIHEYLIRLGNIAFLKGDITSARRWVAEAEIIIKKSSKRLMPWDQTVINCTLGMILNFEEIYNQAEQHTNYDPEDRMNHIPFLPDRKRAYSQIGQGDFNAARESLLKALRSAVTLHAAGWLAQCLPAAALLAASQNQLERATELLALSFHHPAAATGWLEKFPLVVRLRERLEEELSAQVLAEAWERGKALDLTETVTALVEELTLR